jgi:hypothetical protein
MLEFMKLGFKQIAFGGDDSGGGGGGGGSDDSNSPSNYFDDRDGDGVANIFDFDDGVGWADTSAPDTGGGSDDNDDGPTFGEAFAAARAAQGAGGTFTWNGQVYTTNTAEEEQAAADAQAEANRKALLEAQMEEDRKTRAASEAAAVEADRIAKEEAAARMEAEAKAAAAEQERLRLEEAAASFEEEAKAAEELRTMPGQTSRATQFMARYGYDPNDLTAARIAKATPQELADLALATGRTDLTLLLLEQAPGAVLPPIGGGTAVAVGDAPAGTGVTSPEDIYMADEVQTLLEASPEARTVYQDLGITRTMRMNINSQRPGLRSV